MRLHVIGLPHTQTMHSFDHCAYTAKVRKFADMMNGRGLDLILYSPGENEASCTEHVPVISSAQQHNLFSQQEWWPTRNYAAVNWDPELNYWKIYNKLVTAELEKRLEPKDIICFITGWSMKDVIDTFPNHLRVEFGVGYAGVHAKFCVFESYAWMHSVYSMQAGNPMFADGKFFDAVIPNYYDIREFPLGEKKYDEYLLFMSRMIPRKGYEIALRVAELTGRRLVIAGIGGDRPEHPLVEYVGLVDAQERGKLMSQALATLVPTLYVEPFGGVAAESLLCGTPVLTTDWGAFPEYVENGSDGYRCRTMQEFVDGVRKVGWLDRKLIRRRAQKRFSYLTVGASYESYFNRLLTLWGDGFYA